MREQADPKEKARDFFDDLWSHGDPWKLSSSAFEQQKYARYMELLGRRRYERILEIGCGAGDFSRYLATLSKEVLAMDVAPSAIAQARRTYADLENITFIVGDIFDLELKERGPWDLIVLSETIYYLGWLHTFFEVCWLGWQLFKATEEEGHLFLANTLNVPEDYLIRPWIIRTYHSLFREIGYKVDHEDVLIGTKDGIDLTVLYSLFVKPSIPEGQ